MTIEEKIADIKKRHAFIEDAGRNAIIERMCRLGRLCTCSIVMNPVHYSFFGMTIDPPPIRCSACRHLKAWKSLLKIYESMLVGCVDTELGIGL